MESGHQRHAGIDSDGCIDRSALLARLAHVIDTVAIDCSCRDKLVQAIRRFADFEQLRERRQKLSEARLQVTRIMGLLDLLKELDDIGVNEADHTVNAEIAHLFDDVAEAARRGAGTMRSLGRSSGQWQDAAGLHVVAACSLPRSPDQPTRSD